VSANTADAEDVAPDAICAPTASINCATVHAFALGLCVSPYRSRWIGPSPSTDARIAKLTFERSAFYPNSGAQPEKIPVSRPDDPPLVRRLKVSVNTILKHGQTWETVSTDILNGHSQHISATIKRDEIVGRSIFRLNQHA
jgi:hypothetical protein